MAPGSSVLHLAIGIRVGDGEDRVGGVGIHAKNVAEAHLADEIWVKNYFEKISKKC